MASGSSSTRAASLLSVLFPVPSEAPQPTFLLTAHPHPPALLDLQVQAAVDRLLAFGPISSAVEAAKPHLATVRAVWLAGRKRGRHG